MKEMAPYSVNSDLLAKYFAGEATPEEVKAVEAWSAASADNAGELAAQRMLWEDLGAVIPDSPEAAPAFDVDRAWQGVKAKKAAFQKRGAGNWWLRIAAVLVVGIGIGLLVSNYLQEEPLVQVATQQQIRNVDLADGSQITLNKESTISYPRQFAVNERKVELQGEAFFDVRPDAEKPFIIQAGPAVVTVLGTAFNVRTSALLDTVTVFVQSGRVLFAAGDSQVTLTAGEKATYTVGSGLLATTSKITSTGVDQFWRTRRLSFSGHSLPEVVSAIEAAYFVDIELANEALASCSLSVSFEGDTLDNILEVIALTLDLKVTKKAGGVILLSGRGCAEN